MGNYPKQLKGRKKWNYLCFAYILKVLVINTIASVLSLNYKLYHSRISDIIPLYC